ncbi:MAG: periplasmic heavy metal sensor [Alphaproteobacteria bacterium]
MNRWSNWQHSPRAVLTLLLVSLGLNCVVGGVALSAALLYETHAVRIDYVQRLLNTVPPEIYKNLQIQVEARQEEIQTAQRDLQQSRHDIIELIQQPDLDLDALQAKLAATRQASAHIQGIMQDSLVAALHDLPPEDRSKLARAMLRNFSPVVRLFNEMQARVQNSSSEPSKKGEEK